MRERGDSKSHESRYCGVAGRTGTACDVGHRHRGDGSLGSGDCGEGGAAARGKDVGSEAVFECDGVLEVRGRGGAVAAQLAAIDGGPLAMIEPDWARAGTLFHLAQAAHVAGDAALGAAVYDLLRPYDGQLMLFLCTHVPGSAAHALGRAAAATGDRVAAAAHLEDAIAFEDGLGARVLAARSRAALAALA